MSVQATPSLRTGADSQERRLESWKEIAAYLGAMSPPSTDGRNARGVPIRRLHHSRLDSTGRIFSRLSGCTFTFLCQRVEVATARVQHTCAYQLINGIEHPQPFFGIVARCLEEHMQVQALFPHCSE